MRLSLILKSTLFIFSMLCVASSFAQDEEIKDGFKEEQLTFSNGDSRYASYNKEGTKIIFESNRDGVWQIYMMNIDGSAQKRVMTTTSNDRRPKWHPSKNMILFESDRTGTNEIYTHDFDSGKVNQLPIKLNGNKYFGSFAPNGGELMFSYSERADIFDIYACSIKGKRLKKVVSNKFKNVYPNLTSKGDVLIYFSNKNTQGESNIIYSQHLFTKDKNRLTYLKDESTYPDWSNTNGSRRIVYSAQVDDMQHSEIFIMRDDGTHKIQITYNDVEDILPCWSPNDINLLISGFRQGNYQICKVLLKEPLNPDQKPLD